jgi:hypothetical protein
LICFGCGDESGTEARTDNTVCQAMVEKMAVCEPDTVLSDAELAECETHYGAMDQTCADLATALANCQTTNEECDEEGSACLAEHEAFTTECGR